MLSLLSKVCLVNLTNGQHLRKKLCFCLVVQNDVTVNTAQLYLVNKDIDANELEAIKNYLLNPVDSRFKDITVGIGKQDFSESNKTIPSLDFFEIYTAEDFAQYKAEQGLAMEVDDLLHSRLLQVYWTCAN